MEFGEDGRMAFRSSKSLAYSFTSSWGWLRPMITVKFHFRNEMKRRTIPESLTVEELHTECKTLFPTLPPSFSLEVTTITETITITTNEEWLNVVSMLIPGIIHLNICLKPPHFSHPERTTKKLVAPGRPIFVDLRNPLDRNEAINISGRLQSMPDEDVCLILDLCTSSTGNVPLRLSFRRPANQVGTVSCAFVRCGEVHDYSDEYTVPFPFQSDEPFQFFIQASCDRRFLDIRFTKDRSSFTRLPISPFDTLNIDQVLLQSKAGRLVLDSLFHSYTLL